MGGEVLGSGDTAGTCLRAKGGGRKVFFLNQICFSFVHKYESFQVEEMVKRLQQEARDGVEEKKIGERKSVAMVRFKRSWD